MATKKKTSTPKINPIATDGKSVISMTLQIKDFSPFKVENTVSFLIPEGESHTDHFSYWNDLLCTQVSDQLAEMIISARGGK